MSDKNNSSNNQGIQRYGYNHKRNNQGQGVTRNNYTNGGNGKGHDVQRARCAPPTMLTPFAVDNHWSRSTNQR